MRVISGTRQGTHLKSFKGRKIRPTSDRVKEALFNIIKQYIAEDTKVLDLFAGTGNLAIEALSRGADKAYLVEKDRESLSIIRENIKLCRFQEEVEIIPLDVKKAIPGLGKKGGGFDIIFIDPPYDTGLAAETLELLGESTLSEKALVVAECSAREILEERYGKLVLKDIRRYGDTSLSFFERGVD
ncbi:MAG: 16S rRNA (guanine(966)-N(2))-methyltransferase RsmD [Proteobacteria bacterium]|nr:16S rRNA (guanine(966)-N(2))-methyltransferase RsmD [Pseudomonadota bacterium]